MANPTRAEIEAIYALPTFRVGINDSGYTYYTGASIVESPTGQIESNTRENGISFGDAINVGASVKLIAADVTLPAEWQYAKVIIQMTYNGADWMPVFFGYITAVSREGELLILQLGGIDVIINQTKIFSEMHYRRPIASKTSVAVSDDPDDPNWSGGAINEIFWRSGGRPDEQRATYPNATFYYTCEQSLVQPEWVWFSGENLLDELYMLARAGGGQIYQTTEDVISYVQPLSLGNGTSTFTIEDDYYGTYSSSAQTAEQVGTIRAVYTPRYLQGNQIVYEDDTAKLVPASDEIVVEARPQLPVYLYQSQTAATLFKAVNWNADPVTPTLGASYSYYSQKVTLPIENNTSAPFVVTDIVIYGRPVAAGEKQYTSYGSGTPERELEDNPYVQSKQHADQLCRMVHDFYSPILPIITLAGCGYDPDRIVGERVTFNSAYLGITGEYRIVGIVYDLSNVDMTLKLVNVDNLITRDDVFMVGTTYTSGQTRQVSY